MKNKSSRFNQFLCWMTVWVLYSAWLYSLCALLKRLAVVAVVTLAIAPWSKADWLSMSRHEGPLYTGGYTVQSSIQSQGFYGSLGGNIFRIFMF